MNTSIILNITALVISGIVTLVEINYYLTHPHQPGVSPHLIGLGVAVILLAISRLISNKKLDN
jgi:hypothetical protein